MVVFRTHFDGKSIEVPKELQKAPAGEVLVIMQAKPWKSDEGSAWLHAQEPAFKKVWNNDEDAVYDSL